jgi:hypothetical protein
MVDRYWVCKRCRKLATCSAPTHEGAKPYNENRCPDVDAPGGYWYCSYNELIETTQIAKPSEVLRLQAEEYFDISGRGKVAVIDMDKFPKGRTLKVGNCFYLDDKLYMCNGVEMSTAITNKRGILLKEIEFA